MSRALACCLAAAAVGCTTPDYGNGHLQCAPSTRACPDRFYCAADDHCWRQGSGPAGSDLGAAVDLAGTSASDLAGSDLAATASKCASSGALLCESFEGPLLGWGQSATNGTIMRDTTRAFRGVTSLRSHVSASGAMSSPGANIMETSTFPIQGTLYVRLWAWFPSGLPSDFEQFVTVADSGNSGLSLATANGYFVLNNFTVPKYYHQSTTPVPLDRWVCVQLQITQPGPTSNIQVSIDGQPVTDLGEPAGAMPTISQASFGLEFYGNSNPIPTYDAWFDEIIVDNKPTSCDE